MGVLIFQLLSSIADTSKGEPSNLRSHYHSGAQSLSPSAQTNHRDGGGQMPGGKHLANRSRNHNPIADE